MSHFAVCADEEVSGRPSRYTGKEHDDESGNDYFGARYYASTFGRWTVTDWSAKAEPVPYSILTDPQSLNLYSYVRNHPINALDADGHAFTWCSESGTDICTTSDGSHSSPSTGQSKPPFAVVKVSAKRPSVWSRFTSWLSGASSGVGVAMARMGRLGGPAHRAAVRAVSDEWEREGYKTDEEHFIRTPNGEKSYRFVDVHGTKLNEDGSFTERYAQMGRTYTDGTTPVAREQSAIRDIEAAPDFHGSSVEFYDYQAPFPSETGIPGWPVQAAPTGVGELLGGEGDPVLEP